MKDSIARILIASLFVVTAIKGFLDLNSFSKFVGTQLQYPMFFAILALTLKLVAGSMLAVNFQKKYATISLILFMVIVTPLYHNPFQDKSQLTQLLKNVAIIGGLILLL